MVEELKPGGESGREWAEGLRPCRGDLEQQGWPYRDGTDSHGLLGYIGYVKLRDSNVEVSSFEIETVFNYCKRFETEHCKNLMVTTRKVVETIRQAMRALS